MLSVCIPVYNCNITELVNELSIQLKDSSVENEIIVIDDASSHYFKMMNRHLISNSKVIYIELEKNIGRAAIRNLFLEYAKLNYLLFLDCDTKIINKNFINNYLSSLYKNPLVVCGGRTYAKKPHQMKYKLRWKYGIHRECKKADTRKINPWNSFMTNNFVIQKEILTNIKFDERIIGYGHEDSLFGFQLMAHQISVEHIDNETIHNYNESSEEFLNKTKQGLRNLLFISSNLYPDGDFSKINKLLKSYNKIKKIGINWPLAVFSYFVLSVIAIFFSFGIVNLKCFDIYKLFYFCRISVFSTTTTH